MFRKKASKSLKKKEVEAEGFKYMHIFSKSLHSLGFEAVLLTLEPNSKREKVITDAWEFKYILKGEVKYVIDNEEVILKEGDSLYFNGKFPHVPVSISDESCVMLVLYFLYGLTISFLFCFFVILNDTSRIDSVQVYVTLHQRQVAAFDSLKHTV